MSPTARKVARLIGELDSVSRRLKNLVPELQQLDFNTKALQGAKSGLVLSDADAFGLKASLVWGLESDLWANNKEWAENLIKKLDEYREQITGEVS